MAALTQFGLFLLLLHVVHPAARYDLRTSKSTNLSSDALLNIPARLVALEKTMAIIVGELQEDRANYKKKQIQEAEITADINQGRFAIAEKKMLELHDSAIVANIVHDMSGKSDNDFRVLLNLTNSLNSTSLRNRILLNLYYKARDSDHISTANLVTLAKCLSGKQNGPRRRRVISISSFKKLLHKIAENTIATFVDVLKWQGDYPTNSEVRDLAADIAEWRDVSQEVMIGLVSGVFGDVDNKKILEAVYNHTDAWQAMVGVDTLIERLKDTEPFKGIIALDIAVRLNEIVARKNLDSTVENKGLRVKKKIPECIRNLTNLTSFCIRNKHRDSFLTPSGSAYNKHLANVVTAQRCTNCSKIYTWLPLDYNEKFALKISGYVDILQASNISEVGFQRVFSTRLNVNLDDKHAWTLEPAGDSCFMKNSWNNEYLYASDVKFSQNEQNIAGTKAKPSDSPHDNPEFAWQFIDC